MCAFLQTYDKTHLLVNIAGRYTKCSRVGHRGVMHIAEAQKIGKPMRGYTDYGFGRGADTQTVNKHISQTLDTWVNDPELVNMVSFEISP